MYIDVGIVDITFSPFKQSHTKSLEFNRKQKLLKRRQQNLSPYYKNRNIKSTEFMYTNIKEATTKKSEHTGQKRPKKGKK